MADCKFYETHTTFLPSGESTKGRRPPPPSVSWQEWCTHQRSPCTQHEVNLAVNKKLTCGGEMNRCPIAPHPFSDER
jgi:hypothetical protein